MNAIRLAARGFYLFCLLVVLPALADDADPVLDSLQSIRGTAHHKVSSQILERDLQLLVRLPDGYDAAKPGGYPAVYLLDGGATFPMLAGYYRYLRLQEVVPDLIVVGISYGADNFPEGNHRSTDYTAPAADRDYWGGAAAFQQVLQQELLPLVESNYSADPSRRVIFGQSIGGQFVLFTALTQPDLFWGHVASNPALHRNLEFFLELHTDSGKVPSHLFVASASNDESRFREPALKWIRHWQAKRQTPWRLAAGTIEGYGHFSVVSESFRRGMVWLFE